MSISHSDLGAFLEVVRCGSVSRAATALGVTQPSVSKAMRRLEHATGVVLLERGVRGARLSSDGELFHEAAKRFDSQRLDLERVADDLRARQAGLLRLGITSASAENPAVRAASNMLRRRPAMRLRLVIGKSDSLDASVEDGELDLALVPAYPGQALRSSCIELAEDRIQAVARQGHPLLDRSKLDLHSLTPYAWVMASQYSAARKHLFQVFDQAGVSPPQVAVEADYTSEATMGIVASTDLLAMAPASVIRGWLGRVFPLTIASLDWRRSLMLLARPDARWTPLMNEFREQLGSAKRRR